MQFGFGFSIPQIAARRAAAVTIYNLLPESDDYSGWTAVSASRITDGDVPPGFTGASQQWQDTSGTVIGGITRTLTGLTVAAQNVFSAYWKRGEVYDIPNSRILARMVITTGGATARSLDLNITGTAATRGWDTAITSYVVSYLSAGWCRASIYLDGTALGIIGHAINSVTFSPARSAADQHSAYFFGAQLEQGVSTPRAYQKRP